MSGDDEIPEDVVLPIEDAIDLHAFAPRDAKDVVASYLEAAHESGFRRVRIIHGRGIGFQREELEVADGLEKVEVRIPPGRAKPAPAVAYGSHLSYSQ